MTRERIKECGILPVVRIEKAEHAVALAEALLSAGIGLIEVTFRSEAAAEAIERITRSLPEMLVGAGTVRRVDQLDEALKSGAKFIVTPGFNRQVVNAAVNRHIPIYPGVATAGEIEAAGEYGLTTLKFFPAEVSGGVAALKAFFGPYPEICFIPTGGVGPQNLESYAALPNVIAVGGTWLTKSGGADPDFSLIKKRAAEALAIINRVRSAG